MAFNTSLKFWRKNNKKADSVGTTSKKQPEETSAGTSEVQKTGTKKGITSARTSRYATVAKRIGFLVVIVVCAFLILMPFVPQIPYQIAELLGRHDYNPITSATDLSTGSSEDEDSASESIPEVNTLRIPAIDIDVPIVEGQTDTALNHGAWRRPGTGTPEEGGNTVITGHRFKYLPPSNLTFYHLDKVVVGDWVIVYWNEKRYDYQVERVFIVSPDQIEVEAQTAEPQLTLYTCTPLWTASKRLVIVAKPVVLEGDEDSSDSAESADEAVDLEQIDDNLDEN